MDMRRIVFAALTPIAVGAAIAISRPTSAAPRCEASVHAELSHVEPKDLVTTHTYTVEATTMEPCARIHFMLYTTERISKTRVKVFKTPGQVRLRDGSTKTILNYDMRNGRELVRWEVKVTGCERCQP